MMKQTAPKTNLAMADALSALEIVEGVDEYMNQSDSNVLHSPTSVAKLPTTRTTRRKTAVKAEPQPSSSLLVNRSSRLTSKKSLDGEMEQENVVQDPKNNNVKFEANVAKTPAARSTRKAPGATSCRSKVQESNKGELVKSAYSTRRSTRLLEKCMADLSLKSKETLDRPENIEESELKVSAQEKNPAGSEKIEKSELKVAAQEKSSAGSEERIENAKVIPGRDLSASMEKEWEMLEHDSDQVTGGIDGDIADSDANAETNKAKTNEVMSDEKDCLVQEEEETLEADKAISEEGSKQNDKDKEIGDTEIYVDFCDIPALELTNTETINDNGGESKSVEAFDSCVQVEHHEIEEAIPEDVSETEKTNTFDEEAVVDRTDGVSEAEPEEDSSGVDSDGTISEADKHQETEHAVQENDSETEKTKTFDEDTMVDQSDGDSKAEAEEGSSGVDSDGTISDVGSNQADNQETEQAYQENDSETEKINTYNESRMVDQTQTDGDSETEPEEDTEIYVDRGYVLEHANSVIINDNKESKNDQAFDSLVQVEHQETEEAIQENDSEPEKANTFDEEAVVDRTDGDSETEAKEDDSGVNSDGTISEADSNQADNQETEHANRETDSETEKTNTLDEDAVVYLTDGDSEAEPEVDNSGVDSDSTIFEADSNQADNKKTEKTIQENDSETEKTKTFDEKAVVDQTDGDSESELEEEDSSGADSDDTISEADSNQADNQETENAIQQNDPETEKINTFVEDTMVDQTDGNVEGGHSGVHSDVTIYEAGIVDAEMILSESEGSVTAPTSPPVLLEEAIVNTAPLPPLVAESISAQFPRPNKSASMNSAMKLVNVGTTNKENNMDMMIMMNVVNSDDNGESKGEAKKKKKKKVEIDEENLTDVSIGKLVKMVKALSLKSSNNRAPLQILPSNNQIAD